MSTILYYFSATGNSLHAAKSIAANLDDCAVAPIPSFRQQAEVVVAADSAGLVFPLHCFGLPLLVSEFAAKLTLNSARYIFAVITCGDPLLSGAFRQLNELFALKGRQLDAGFRVKMVSNYTPLSNIPPAGKRQKLLQKADEKLAAVAGLIKAGQRTVEPEYFSLPCSFINNQWQKRAAGTDAEFTNSADCIACGRCAQICPADNIALADGKPEWRHACTHCMACLHACPAQSINYGSRTRKRQRYLHPKIALEELFAEMEPPR